LAPIGAGNRQRQRADELSEAIKTSTLIGHYFNP
jgi:hypothetical protein